MKEHCRIKFGSNRKERKKNKIHKTGSNKKLGEKLRGNATEEEEKWS
jgi:hypothetical protein